MKTKFDLQISHIPTCQSVYRKLASADYHFESEVLYTFADIGRLIGVSSMGIRQRALYDQWPLVSVHVRKGQGRRNHYVKGEFIQAIKSAACRHEAAPKKEEIS